MSAYTFYQGTSEDHDLVLDFINEHFVPHEPVNSAIKLCDVGYRYLLTLMYWNIQSTISDRSFFVLNLWESYTLDNYQLYIMAIPKNI